MTRHADRLRQILAPGACTASQIGAALGVSQQAVSRAVVALGDEVVRIGAARSTRYLLRDTRRGVPEVPVYCVGDDGRVSRLGRLLPVRPDGYVLHGDDGRTTHHEGLPWWMADMRAAGFLGRAWAARHAQSLGLPSHLPEWSDTDHLRALLAHGWDAAGHLLLGDLAHERHLSSPEPRPIPAAQRASTYTHLAEQASRGELPGSSAGGEQPKFTAYAETAHGPAHVIVKFTLPERNPVTERWSDLLLAEHHALQTLRAADVPAARTELIDHAGQRFLQVERFDRVGPLGRRPLLSLASLDAEFTAAAPAPWPLIVSRLADAGHVTPAATEAAALRYAFGTLIGNTDMHPGNLSFTGPDRPWALAPAYDMLPMGFAPTAGGALPSELAPPMLRPVVPAPTWRRALELAEAFLARVRDEGRWSERWGTCVVALERHVEGARLQIGRME